MPIRLLCDEMLAGLARWLRAAGYDTELANGLSDREVIARCRAEGRGLITRDRHLATVTPPDVRTVIAEGEGIDGTARSVSRQLQLDWQRAPFTRCLLDNTRLVPAAPSHCAAVPRTSRVAGGPIRTCPVCHRIYWPGGHVRRMEARMREWQSESGELESPRPAP
jgi:uncharacterized protein